MKKLTSILNHNRPFAASVAAILAVSLWLAPTSSQAQTEKADQAATETVAAAADTKSAAADDVKGEGQPCRQQVCHQRRVTLEFNCGSAGLRRHQSHGDPLGPCPATRPAEDEE
jgi:hypothetical protein